MTAAAAAGSPTAYPLAWPFGWPRTAAILRMDSRFRTHSENVDDRKRRDISLPDARERLSMQLDKIDGRGTTLSMNIELRLDGTPRPYAAEPEDPGVAVYFQLHSKPIVLACDRWRSVAGNIAAIAAHLKAMRDMERWGVGTAAQMFTGYMALPAPISPDDWRAALGAPATLAEAEARYRDRIKTCLNQGPTAAALNAAITHARRELSV